MSQGHETLFERYQLLEQSFPVKDIGAKYTNLVTANGNQQFPVQRWFHLKEAFSVVCQELCKISAPGCLVDGASMVSLWKCKLRMTA